MLIVLALTTLADCSAQPTPDQVSPVPTEGIVSRARCELRQGLVETVRDQWFPDEEPPVDPKIIDPETVAEHLNEMKKRYPTIDLTNDWNEYMDIAVSYDWAFDIMEINEADGSLGFSFPAGTFDTSGKLNLQREGKRTFKTQDTFGNLLTKQWYDFCHDINRSVIAYPNQTPVPRGQNIIYPMTGSIGLDEAVKSFLRIAVQGGGLLGTFTDELAFTTTVDAKAGATVSLAPLADKLRVMSGTTNLDGNRVDVHKVKISLTFPRTRLAQLVKKKLVADVLKELDAKAGYKLNPNWRSAYALCVVDGRAREDELKVLRPDPPEFACIKSTDAFLPRGSGVANVLHSPGTKFGHLGLLKKPFSMTKGGYVTVTKKGKVTQKFGSKAKEKRFAEEDRRQRVPQAQEQEIAHEAVARRKSLHGDRAQRLLVARSDFRRQSEFGPKIL